MSIKHKVYISGKITGDPGYRMKFAQAERELMRKGCAVLNPASLPDGMKQDDYMRIRMAMLDCADIVMLLPDWKESRGANLEVLYAERVGKPVQNIW